MNVSELSAALHEQANEIDATAQSQLTLVHARVHRVRRRRAVAVGILGAAAVAAVVLTLVLPRGATRSEPAAPRPVVFLEHVGHYHLVRTETGAAGDNQVALSVPTPATEFLVSAACRGPRGELDTRLVANGTSVGGVTCAPDPPVLIETHVLIGFSADDLKGTGVDLTQKSLVISLTLVRGRYNQVPTTDREAVLGIAIYERDG